MSAYVTLYITRSRAKEEMLKATLGEVPDSQLEAFMDNVLESSLHNCIIVDDDRPNNDEDI